MYQSGNKHKKYENHITNGFVVESIGKQNIRIMKNTFFDTKSCQNHEGSFISLNTRQTRGISIGFRRLKDKKYERFYLSRS